MSSFIVMLSSKNVSCCRMETLHLFLKKKQIILLIGENGAGKSSLLDTIAGLIQPQSGSVKIEGRHIQEIGISKKETFTYIPHQSCLMENFTVLENLKIWIELNSFNPCII